MYRILGSLVAGFLFLALFVAPLMELSAHRWSRHHHRPYYAYYSYPYYSYYSYPGYYSYSNPYYYSSYSYPGYYPYSGYNLGGSPGGLYFYFRR